MIPRRFTRFPFVKNNFFFCSLSSPPSSSIRKYHHDNNQSSIVNFILAELKQFAPVGAWTPLGNIASCLSEEAQEAVAEYGGLRRFLETTPEARTFFDIQQQHDQKNQQNVNNHQSGKTVIFISQKRVMDNSSAFPPAPASSSFANNNINNNGNENYSTEGTSQHGGPKYKNPSSSYSYHRPNPSIFNNFYEVANSQQDNYMTPREIQKLKAERLIVQNVPSFPVPLVEVVKLELEDNNNSTKKDIEVTLKDCRNFIQNKIEPNGKHLVDLLFPFDSAVFEDVWEALLDPKNEHVQSIDDIRNYCFISILPPFVATHLNPSVDELLAESCRVADYDMCRLARYLSNDNFVTVTSLINSNVPSLLQKPVMHVVAAFPNHFEYIPPNGKLPADAPFIAGVEESCKSAEDKGCPKVDLSSSSSSSNSEQNEHQLLPCRDLGSIRFILAPSELEHGLGGVPEKIRKLDFQLLQELYKALSIRRKTLDEPAPDGSRFGMAKVPTGISRVKVKHQVIRSLVRIRFPRGNPFFDRNVFAHYIFDHLPETLPIPIEEFRGNYLPEHGRTASPLSADFLRSFPHLFIAVQGPKNEWIVQRADAEEGKGRLKQKPEDEITEQEIIDSVWANLPPKFDFTVRTALSGMMNLLPMAHQNRIRVLGGIQFIFRRHPNQFIFSDDKSDFFTWGEPPVSILASMLEKEREKGQQMELDVQQKLDADRTAEDRKKMEQERLKNTNVVVLSVNDVVLEEMKKLDEKKKK